MGTLESDQIRLLDLLPGDEAAGIQCKVRVVALSTAPEYEALSYVWGDTSHGVEIEVCQTRTTITNSLYSVLRRIRRPDAPRTLWIDQLCIDQTNLDEKASQVQKMRTIYSSCTQALLWIGDVYGPVTESDAATAVRFIENLASNPSFTPDHLSAMPRPLFEATITALKAISEAPWWSRVWTVQEAVLPARAMFLWGASSLSWDVMNAACRTWMPFVRRYYTNYMESPGNLYITLVRFAWLASAKEQRATPMFNMIVWRERKATDDSDNAYALTGLHPAGTLPRTELCHYHLGTAEVFTRLTMDLIYAERPDGDLLPLAIDPRLEDGIATKGVPRWAFDARSLPMYSVGVLTQFHRYSYRNANRGLTRLTLTQRTPRTLDLDGVAVDTVRLVGKQNRISGSSTILPKAHLLQSWRDTRMTAHKDHTLPGSQNKTCDEDAFCCLLMGDLVGDTVVRDGRQHPVLPHHVAAARDMLANGWTEDDAVCEAIRDAVRNRRFFITQSGRMGLGHLETQPGDQVWVFSAGRVPFLVRKRTGPAEDDVLPFDFIGACYVKGIMKGELFDAEHTYTQQIARLY